jgi:hypothetical protein
VVVVEALVTPGVASRYDDLSCQKEASAVCGGDESGSAGSSCGGF